MTLLYIVLVIALIVLLVLIWISNNCLKITEYEIKNNKIPDSFNDYKIIQISDTHSKEFGKNNEKFIKLVENEKPDIIIMSGDIVDGRQKNIQKTISMFKPLYDKYPVFYSEGNHEQMLDEKRCNEYYDLLKKCGVKLLVDDSTYIEKNGERIRLLGLKYYEIMKDNSITIDKKKNFVKIIKCIFNDINTDEYNILIAHDPENFEIYEELKPDLIFSGHVHGGLIRFGKVAILSPRRRLFPKYGYGKNIINNTTMITSSGSGNATIPIRLFNRPEIVKVILKSK